MWEGLKTCFFIYSLDLRLAEQHVLPDYGVVLPPLQLPRRLGRVLAGCVEVTCLGRGDELELLLLLCVVCCVLCVIVYGIV